MKDLAIVIVLFIVMLFTVGDLKITFNPFTVKMPNYINLIGFVLLMIGFVIIRTNDHNKALKQGFDNGVEMYEKAIKEIITEKTKNKEQSTNE